MLKGVATMKCLEASILLNTEACQHTEKLRKCYVCKRETLTVKA